MQNLEVIIKEIVTMLLLMMMIEEEPILTAMDVVKICLSIIIAKVQILCLHNQPRDRMLLFQWVEVTEEDPLKPNHLL